MVVVTRGNPAGGDSLRPFEQLVLNHLAARAFNDVTSANTLASSHHRLDRRWWLRFDRTVATDSQQLGLTDRRYTPSHDGTRRSRRRGRVCWRAGSELRGGDQIAISDSWKPRTVWLAALIALATLAWNTAYRAIGSAPAADRSRCGPGSGVDGVPAAAPRPDPRSRQRARPACPADSARTGVRDGGRRARVGRVAGGARGPPNRLVGGWRDAPHRARPVPGATRIRPTSAEGRWCRHRGVLRGALDPGIPGARRATGKRSNRCSSGFRGRST